MDYSTYRTRIMSVPPIEEQMADELISDGTLLSISIAEESIESAEASLIEAYRRANLPSHHLPKFGKYQEETLVVLPEGDLYKICYCERGGFSPIYPANEFLIIVRFFLREACWNQAIDFSSSISGLARIQHQSELFWFTVGRQCLLLYRINHQLAVETLKMKLPLLAVRAHRERLISDASQLLSVKEIILHALQVGGFSINTASQVLAEAAPNNSFEWDVFGWAKSAPQFQR